MQKFAIIPAIISLFLNGFQQFSVLKCSGSEKLSSVELASAPYYAGASELVYEEKKIGESEDETYITFTLTNVSQIAPIDGYDFDMESFPAFRDADRIVLSYPSGMIMRLRWSDDMYTETEHTHYTPAGFDFNEYGIDFDTFHNTEKSDIPELWRVDMGEYIDCIVYFKK